MTSTFPFLRDVSRFAVLNPMAEAKVGRSVVEEFGVVAQGPNDPVVSLSGGNQQKVVVGRWLRLALGRESAEGRRRTLAPQAADRDGSQ